MRPIGATLLLILFPLATLSSQQKIRIVEGKIKRLVPIGMPDPRKNDFDFYRLDGIACSDDGRLFILDSPEGCIRVFSIETAQEIQRLSKIGSGPGEFRRITSMKILPGDQLCILDNSLKRCTIFDRKGDLLRTISLKVDVDDIDFIDENTIVASNFLFDFASKPLSIISLPSGATIQKFGEVIEPNRGTIGTISRFSPSHKGLYSGSGTTFVLISPDKKSVLYSQIHPYSLVRYDLNSKKGIAFAVPVNIDTDDNFRVEVKSDGKGVKFHSGPCGGGRRPEIHGSNLLVPIFDAEGKTNYLDVYSLTYQFKSRYRIPAFAKDTRPLRTTFRGTKELLVQVINDLGIQWIERFSIPSD
jgi:hypothetical protein